MKKLSEEEVQCDSKVTWYLPHRFVINPKKPDRLRRAWPEICDSQRFETRTRVSKKNSYYARVLASDYIQQIMASGVRYSSKNSRGIFLQMHNISSADPLWDKKKM